MGALRKIVAVCQARWFVPCVALAALAAIDLPVVLKAVSTSHGGG